MLPIGDVCNGSKVDMESLKAMNFKRCGCKIDRPRFVFPSVPIQTVDEPMLEPKSNAKGST